LFSHPPLLDVPARGEPIRISGQLDWIGLSSVLRPCQHSIGYMGDGFYRSKYPTNSIKVTEGSYSTQTNQTHNKQT